jgi:methionine synthase I (cobalamin-dependent)
MGRKLIEHTLPEIARQLERIADALEDKKPDQVTSAFKAYVHSGASDSEIVKQLKQIWQK